MTDMVVQRVQPIESISLLKINHLRLKCSLCIKPIDDENIKTPYQIDPQLQLNYVHQFLASYRHQKDHNETILQSDGELSAGIVEQINQKDAKIVHLHWVCNFLSVEDIAKIDKPIVWTLHDMWPFSGSEHFTLDSDAYFYNEPEIITRPESNHRTWLKKINLWRNKTFSIVAPSKWIANQARKSILFRNCLIQEIPLPIDTNFWFPLNKNDLNNHSINKPTKKRILFSAYNAILDHNKGWDLLKKSLLTLYQLVDFEFEILVLGHEGEIVQNLPFEIYSLGVLHDDQAIREIYSNADVMVIPSRLETFSQVCLEAQACALPVVAFDVGGIPDMITHQRTGWISKPYDTVDFSVGIHWVLKDEQRRLFLSRNARSQMINKYSTNIIAEKYLNLYEQIIS